MKTTIEIPDPLFRRAKSKAAERGETLKEFVTAALQERLATSTGSGGPAWMQGPPDSPRRIARGFRLNSR